MVMSRDMSTLWAVSLEKRQASSLGEPMVKQPADTVHQPPMQLLTTVGWTQWGTVSVIGPASAASSNNLVRPPHAESPDPISAWIALCDVPVERGAMTFIPESHQKTDLPAQSLNDPRSLFTICPELEDWPRVTLPLKAGDCTFHHGRTAHMAAPNSTDVSRLAHVVIYMDRETRYQGAAHVVTDPLELKAGDRLDGPLFPEIPHE